MDSAACNLPTDAVRSRGVTHERRTALVLWPMSIDDDQRVSSDVAHRRGGTAQIKPRGLARIGPSDRPMLTELIADFVPCSSRFANLFLARQARTANWQNIERRLSCSAELEPWPWRCEWSVIRSPVIQNRRASPRASVCECRWCFELVPERVCMGQIQLSTTAVALPGSARSAPSVTRQDGSPFRRFCFHMFAICE